MDFIDGLVCACLLGGLSMMWLFVLPSVCTQGYHVGGVCGSQGHLGTGH